MTISRPQWSPATYEQVIADIASGVVVESQYTDFKAEVYGTSDGEKHKAAVDMASLAVDALFGQLQINTDWAPDIPGNWSPERGQWTYQRAGTGVEASCTGTAHTSTPLAGILAVDESGAVRMSYNYLLYGPAGGDGRAILRWQDLIAATLWSLAFAQAIGAEAGTCTTLAVGVHAEGIKGMIPGEPNDGLWGQQRNERSLARDPIPVDSYDATTHVSVAELAGDWRHAVDRLFGQLIRTMGLGDLLARPQDGTPIG